MSKRINLSIPTKRPIQNPHFIFILMSMPLYLPNLFQMLKFLKYDYHHFFKRAVNN